MRKRLKRWFEDLIVRTAEASWQEDIDGRVLPLENDIRAQAQVTNRVLTEALLYTGQMSCSLDSHERAKAVNQMVDPDGIRATDWDILSEVVADAVVVFTTSKDDRARMIAADILMKVSTEPHSSHIADMVWHARYKMTRREKTR